MVGRRLPAVLALAALVALTPLLSRHHVPPAAAPGLALEVSAAPPPPPPPPPPPGRALKASEPETVPLHPSAAHGLPFAVYHAFTAAATGCDTATFIGQLEGACDARQRTLERAGIDDWRQWRRDLVVEKKGCKVCVASQWRSRVRRAMATATSEEYESRAVKKVFCAFAVPDSDEEIIVEASTRLAEYLKKKSTVIFSCAIPPALRAAACSSSGGVSARVAPSLDPAAAHPRIPVLLQRDVDFGDGPRIGACAWVRGGAYLDRDHVARGLPGARVAEWLAHLVALGVERVAVYDNSAGVPLTPASRLFLLASGGGRFRRSSRRRRAARRTGGQIRRSRTRSPPSATARRTCRGPRRPTTRPIRAIRPRSSGGWLSRRTGR